MSVIVSFSPMFGLLCFAVALVAVGVWAIVTAFRMAAAIWRRRWRNAALSFVALLSLLPCRWMVTAPGDYMHLALMYPFYSRKINAPGNQGHDQIPFGWGGLGFAGSGLDRSLVYDRTDKLAHEIGLSSLPNDPSVVVITEHLAGRFYVVQLSY